MKKIIGVFLSLTLIASSASAECVIDVPANVMSFSLAKKIDKIESQGDLKMRWTKFFINTDMAVQHVGESKIRSTVLNINSLSYRSDSSGYQDGWTVESAKSIRDLKANFTIDYDVKYDSKILPFGCENTKYTQYLVLRDANTNTELDSMPVASKYWLQCTNSMQSGGPETDLKWFNSKDVQRFIKRVAEKHCQ